MSRSRSVFLFLALLLFSITQTAIAQDAPEAWNAGHYIIKFNAEELESLREEIPQISSLSNDALEALLSEIINSEAVDSFSLIKARLIKSSTGEDIDVDTTLDLLELGIVDYVEPDLTYQAINTPNDSRFSELWGMNQANNYDIDAPQAWDITTGNSSNPVVVGVVDTGVDYNHVDLKANMWVNTAEKNGTTGVDDDGNGVVDDIYGYNGITQSGDPMDDHSQTYSGGSFYTTNTFHGTHCAGTIGAVANNNEGVAGVAWNVKIMGLKFLNYYGSGSTSGAIRAVQYAVMMRQRGVNLRVLSNSWGGGGFSQSLLDVIRAADAAGIIFTAAAGNNATNTDLSIYYPQGYDSPNVVSVAAADRNGALASFSNYGATTVDLAAPGVSILSTRGGGSNSYHSLSGTSMATPHVSGVAAIAFSGDSTLTPASVKQLMMNTVKPVAAFNGKMQAPGFVNLLGVARGTVNHPPTISPIAAQTLAANEASRSVPITVADQDGDSLTVTPQVLIPSHRQVAADADSMWQFVRYDSSLDNSLSMNEKHLFSATKSFIIFSDGKIYRSDPTYLWLQSAAVDPNYYVSPALLVNAYPVSVADVATVIVGPNNGSVTVTPGAAAFGGFSVRLTVSDGRSSASTDFQVEIGSNNKPVISPIADQITAWQIPINVHVTASDSDNEEVTLTTAVEDSNATAYGLDQENDLRAYGGMGQNYQGRQEKYLYGFKSGLIFFILPDGNFYHWSGSSDTSPLVAKLETRFYDDTNLLINVPTPSRTYPGLATFNGNTLRLDGKATYSGVFRITVTATDIRNASANRFFWLNLSNSAPELAEIQSRTVNRGVSSLAVPLSAIDANDDLLTYSAKLLAPANNSVATLAVSGSTLNVSLLQARFGSFGVEVTVSDGDKSSSRSFTISQQNNKPVIAPISNQSVHWTATSFSMPISASDPDNDTLTFSASPTLANGDPYSGAASFSGNQITVSKVGNFVGTVVISVTATDGLLSDNKQFQLTFANQAPTLAAISNQAVHARANSLAIPLSAADGDGDSLTYSARLLPPANSGTSLSLSNGVLNLGFANGYQGSFDIEVSVSDGIQTVTKTATITRQNQAPVLQAIANRQVHWNSGPVVVPLSASDAEGDNISLSVSAVTLSGGAFPGSVSLSGNNLTVTPPAAYVGTVVVTASASDGIASSSRAFSLGFTNTAPVLAAISNRVVGKTISSATIPVTASDADNDQLSLSTRITTANSQGVQIALANNSVTANFADDFIGTSEVEVTVSDGAASSSQRFTITRENTAPVLESIANRSVHWTTSAVSVPVSAVDADNDSVTLTATAQVLGGGAFSGNVVVANSVVTVTAPTAYVGTVVVTVTASDGSRSNSKSFQLQFGNAKPVLAAIGNKALTRNQNSVTIPISASDADGDGISYSARVLAPNTSNAQVTVSGANVVVTLVSGYYGSFNVEVSAGDGAETTSQTFQVSRSNSVPVIQAIADKTVHWTSHAASIPLVISDADNDNLTVSASAVSLTTVSFNGTVQVNNSTLVVTPTRQDFVDRLLVTVTASDGLLNNSVQFRLTFQNSKPVLPALENKTVGTNITSVSVPISAVDTDGDTLTYTARLVSGGLAGNSMTLNGQTVNLTLAPGFGGAMVVEATVTDGAETDTKTFSVTKQNTTPVLESIADQSAHWKSVPVSVSLVATDGDGDSLTLSATSTLTNGQPFAGQTTISGNTLRITPPVGFLGQVRTTVTANDGLATATRQFVTTVRNARPQLAALSNKRVGRNTSVLQVPLAGSDADNDSLSFSAAVATSGAQGINVAISNSTLNVTLGSDFGHGADITVNVSDGIESGSATFHITRENVAPSLNAISNITKHWSAMPVDVTLSATDADNDSLTYSATAKTYQEIAYEQDQAHDFYLFREYFLNWHGRNEKYVRGDNGNSWFFIYPSGELYRYTGTNLDAAVRLAKFNSRYYDDPSLLFNVSVPSANDKPTLAVNNNVLSINSRSGYVGQFLVSATASDGELSDTKDFYINVTNTKPQLTLPTEKIVRKNVNSVTVPLNAVDADGDSVTFSAALVAPANSGAELTVANGQLTVAFAEGYIGTFDVDVTANDGAESSKQTIHFGRQNIKPSLSAITDKEVHWRNMPLSVALSASDEDGDTVSFSATAKTHQQALYELDQAHDFFFYQDYFYNARGKQEKYFRGDGGRNRYVIYPNGDLYLYNPTNESASTFLTRLSARHYADPNLIFNVSQPSSAQNVTASISGTTLNISASSGYVGELQVTVSASDGEASDSKTFFVNVGNTLPGLSEISNRTIGKKATSLSIPITASDSDGDSIQLSARLVGSVTDTTLSLAGQNLNLSFGSKYSGSFTVEVSANDGAETTLRQFTVTRQNSLPVFGAVAERTLHWRQMPTVVFFSATDGDDDQITYSASAKALSGNSIITASVNGPSVTVSSNDNYVGPIQVTLVANDGEGTTSKQFIVNVRNAIPALAGIANRTIGKTITSQSISLSAPDSDGDNVTLSAQIVSGGSSGAQLNLSGSNLSVSFQNSYIGTLAIEVSATDGAQTAKQTFSITRKNLEPVMSAVEDRSVHWKQMPVSISLTATDGDNDPVRFSASVKTVSDLVYQLDQAHDFYVDSSFNYNWHGREEKYLKGDNGKSWFLIYPDGTFYKYAGSDLSKATFIARLHPRYHEDPSLLINVQPPTGDDGIYLSIVDNVLSVDTPDDYVGNLKIAVTASDGTDVDIKEFNLNVLNNPPVISSLVDEERKVSDGPFTKTFNASDPDSEDELTVSATIERENQLAYDLDRAHNFYFLRSFYYNFRGGSEKYFRGNEGWYLVLPNGKLYLWTGSSQPTGVYLATLDVAFYENPYLLFDVAEPTNSSSPAEVALSGDQLMVTPRSGFTGVFFVATTATDGSLTTTERFKVTISPDSLDTPDDLALDSDGDGVSDADEIAGGTDRFDAGSFIPSLKSPVYVLWNGFLNMTNILELVNPNEYTMNVNVSIYAIDGHLVHVQPVAIEPMKQYDLILNGLPGFQADSYGIAKVEFEGIMDGRISFYRNSEVPGEFDFAYSVPFADPSQGITSVSFNTFQPSLNPAEARNIVANWLTIVNFASVGKGFVIKTYNQVGQLITERHVSVPGFGRVDIDGGHGLLGPSVVGTHVIIPEDARSAYTAQITRYAGNTDGTLAPTKYSFAFPLVARAGTGRRLVMPMTRQFGESNWVELINTAETPVESNLRLLNTRGQEIFSEVAMLAPHSQKHYEVSSYLRDGETGIVLVNANTQNALIMQSMVYFRNSSGSVEAMYGSQGKEAIGHAIFGSYNRYLGMENWLKVVNYSETSSQIKLTVNSGTSSVEEIFELPAYGSVVLPIHDGQRYGTKPDSYGTVELRIADGANFFSELLRVKRAGNAMDIAAPTTVR